jgi:hypothetical protein
MDLQGAVAVARQRLDELFAADPPRDVRLEGLLYDDHLMVWSLTIGFALPSQPAEPPVRTYKIVRVAEADKSVLSIVDR